MRALAGILLAALLVAHVGALAAHRIDRSITVQVIYQLHCDGPCPDITADNRLGRIVARNLRRDGGFQPINDITSWVSRENLYSTVQMAHVVFVLRGPGARAELAELVALTEVAADRTVTIGDLLARAPGGRPRLGEPAARFHNLTYRDSADLRLLDVVAMAIIVVALGVILLRPERHDPDLPGRGV